MTEECTRLETKLKTKFHQKETELLTRIDELEQRLKEQEENTKQREDNELRKNIEYQKLNALVEQKLAMTETELKDYKAKWALKEADLKEINKELMQSRKEVLGYADKLRVMEREHAEELAKV
jgi:hypothetical protein